MVEEAHDRPCSVAKTPWIAAVYHNFTVCSSTWCSASFLLEQASYKSRSVETQSSLTNCMGQATVSPLGYPIVYAKDQVYAAWAGEKEDFSIDLNRSTIKDTPRSNSL